MNIPDHFSGSCGSTTLYLYNYIDILYLQIMFLHLVRSRKWGEGWKRRRR
jgi:hypothetical protein